MKSILKQSIVAIIILAVGFTACKKEDETAPANLTKENIAGIWGVQKIERETTITTDSGTVTENETEIPPSNEPQEVKFFGDSVYIYEYLIDSNNNKVNYDYDFIGKFEIRANNELFFDEADGDSDDFTSKYSYNGTNLDLTINSEVTGENGTIIKYKVLVFLKKK